MDRKKFYDYIRKNLTGSLSQKSVEGFEAVLNSLERNKITDQHHAAHILAHVYHETGGYVYPIKETVYASHKDKNPSDATVIARLDSAWKKGQLSWVRTPYWRDGWFGRGMIQLTHKNNYEKMGKRLGVNLVGNPSLALDPDVSADSAVVGMSEGMFTGKKLSNYKFPDALYAKPKDHPRRIVNGEDGTDEKITNYHNKFYKALSEAGYLFKSTQEFVQSDLTKISVSAPETTETSVWSHLGGLLGKALLLLFTGRTKV